MSNYWSRLSEDTGYSEVVCRDLAVGLVHGAYDKTDSQASSIIWNLLGTPEHRETRVFIIDYGRETIETELI